MLSSVNPVDYSPLTCLTTSADISVWHSGCLSSSSHPDVCEIYGLRLLLSQSPSDTNTPLFLSLFTAHKHIQMQTTTFHQSLTGTDIKPLINFSSTLSSPTYMVSNRGLSLPVSLFLFLSHAANTWWQSWWNINVFSEVLLFGELPWPWVFFHPSLSSGQWRKLSSHSASQAELHRAAPRTTSKRALCASPSAAACYM